MVAKQLFEDMPVCTVIGSDLYVIGVCPFLKF